jgi:hypothetical protein
MSTIASLVIKASGRSVSNGGWLYFNGKSEDYCTFRAKCRLFQETYHKATPPPALVKMFGEWNLAEDVACHIEGVEDMPAAWRKLDSIYGTPLALTTDQTPDEGWMLELPEGESGVGSEAEPTSEEEPAPLKGGNCIQNHRRGNGPAGSRSCNQPAREACLHQHAARDKEPETPLGAW